MGCSQNPNLVSYLLDFLALTFSSLQRKFECFPFFLRSLRGLEEAENLRADLREGDEDSNFSVFRVRRFSEWPELLH